MHKTKRQIEELIAALAPPPDVPTVVRKLPERQPTIQPCSPVLPISKPTLCPDRVVRSEPVPVCQPEKPVEPLAPSRYKIPFTAGAELHEKLKRRSADLATVIDQAVTEKIERLETRRYGKTCKRLAAGTGQFSRQRLAPSSSL